MAKFFKNSFKLASADLANQYALPVKSATGWAVSKIGARRTSVVNKLVVERLALEAGDKVLELGYGRGDGISYCLQLLQGDGLVCGIERSHYMEEVVRKRFILELAESNLLSLDRSADLRNLPYPSNLFTSAFHVDVFYFIHQDRMPEVCRELCRVLRPGADILCGMEFKRLEKLTRWGLLHKTQWDPMRYMSSLESAGFQDIKVDYVDESSNRQLQLISARKPDVDETHLDVEAQMAHLERQIKRELVMTELQRSGRAPSKDDLAILREEIERK